MLTHYGSRFYSNLEDKKGQGGRSRVGRVPATPAGISIKHIVGRVQHPKANGMAERLYVRNLPRKNTSV